MKKNHVNKMWSLLVMSALPLAAAFGQAPTLTAEYPVANTNLITLYGGSGGTIGSSPTFSVSASGTMPIGYQWRTNGVAMGGATNASFTFTDAQTGGPTNFDCVVSNTDGSITSMVWSVTYVPAPAAPFAQAMLALHPMAYWRLNEPDDGLSDGDTGIICKDYASGNNGFYNNVALGNAGYDGITNPVGTISAASFGYNYNGSGSYANGFGNNIDFGTQSGSNAEFSVAAWVNGEGQAQSDYAAGIVSIGNWGSEQFTIDEGAGGNDLRFVTRDASGANYALLNSAVNLGTDANWHYVVAVCDEAHTNLSFYIDGQLVSTSHSYATGPTVYESGLLAGDTSLKIGSRNYPGPDAQFFGKISDVAIYNYPLTAGQVSSSYAQASGASHVAPFVLRTSTNAYVVGAGTPLTIPVQVAGTAPMSYSWYDEGGATMVTTGTTVLNANLTIAQVPAAWNGDTLLLTVTNAYGSANYSVTLIVTNFPLTLGAQYPTPNTNVITLYGGSGGILGSSPTFSISASGTTPIVYQWRTNGVPMAGATNASLTFTNAQMDGPTKFDCVITNPAGPLTSKVWTVTYVPAPTAPFPQSVLVLRPMAFWRLTEPDDGLSDGNPGAICTDYAGGNNAIYTNVDLGDTGWGGITNPDGTVEAASFGYDYGNSFASWTGSNIDFATPAGNNAEFSVAAWVNGENEPQGYGAGLVSIGLWGGEEFTIDEGGGTGAAPFYTRFVLVSASGSYYIAGSTLDLSSDANWHYVVAVCDEANGIASFYVDGRLAGTAGIPVDSGLRGSGGIPLMIGARPFTTFNGQQQFYGEINDVAVYNYPLSSSQISAQYYTSIGVPPAVNAVGTVSNNTLRLTATVMGTPPLSYHWYDVNANSYFGGQTNDTVAVTNDTLVISNFTGSDSYYLAATNAYGSTNSATIVVQAPSRAASAIVRFPDASSNHLVSVEAEDYNQIMSSSADAHTWDFTTTPLNLSPTDVNTNYSGDGVMEAQPVNQEYLANATTGPELGYQVYFPSAGTYYIWIRGVGDGSPGPAHYNAMNFGLDGTFVGLVNNFPQGQGYNWAAGSAAITVATPGLHTINAWMRKDGFDFDKLLITSNSGYVPTGAGPAESFAYSGIKMMTAGDGSLTLTWNNGGTLQSSTNVAGPYVDMTGVTNPATITPTGTSMFFRIKY
jgi:Concanavalin A-like lectin/glucanases superfamily/Gylcosyl hydrolase family 115 C-terminal domain